MTRIGKTYANTYRPALTGPRGSGRPGARTASQAVRAVEADIVSDRAIEEVVFEPNNGIDQRGRQRGFAVSELKEEVLVERTRTGQHGHDDLNQDQFWQRFSTPFMAQMIGQNSQRPMTDGRGYAQPALATPQKRLSRAV